MKITNQEVTYVDHMGSDLSIVNAARVSFNKVSSTLTDGDKKLISYLAEHNHWTPFGHASVSLRIKCPIFVARQLGKHQVGLVWNEVSRRYVDEEPEFYFPDQWRGRPVNAKQGSSNEVISVEVTGMDYYENIPEDSVTIALEAYTRMIKRGVAPEQARMVLPQNTMTEFIWTGSLAAFCRVCKLRLDPHSQLETQEIAKGIGAVLEKLFPVGYKSLME